MSSCLLLLKLWHESSDQPWHIHGRSECFFKQEKQLDAPGWAMVDFPTCADLPKYIHRSSGVLLKQTRFSRTRIGSGNCQWPTQSTPSLVQFATLYCYAVSEHNAHDAVSKSSVTSVPRLYGQCSSSLSRLYGQCFSSLSPEIISPIYANKSALVVGAISSIQLPHSGDQTLKECYKVPKKSLKASAPRLYNPSSPAVSYPSALSLPPR